MAARPDDDPLQPPSFPLLLGKLESRLEQYRKAIASYSDEEEYKSLLNIRCPLNPKLLASSSPTAALLAIDLSRKQLNKLLKKSNRKQLRERIGDAVALREVAFRQRKLKKVIQSIMGAKGSQVDLTMLREVFSQTGANSQVLKTDGEDMQNRDHSCYFSGAHAAKDSTIAWVLGAETGLPMPLAAATKLQFDRMNALGLGALDKSGVAELTFKGRHA
jgi:hypothetical protein